MKNIIILNLLDSYIEIFSDTEYEVINAEQEDVLTKLEKNVETEKPSIAHYTNLEAFKKDFSLIMKFFDKLDQFQELECLLAADDEPENILPESYLEYFTAMVDNEEELKQIFLELISERPKGR